MLAAVLVSMQWSRAERAHPRICFQIAMEITPNTEQGNVIIILDPYQPVLEFLYCHIKKDFDCIFLSAFLTTLKFLTLLCKHKGARALKGLVN